MQALAKFRSYLFGGKFIIKTYHNNIKYFMKQKDLNDRQKKSTNRLHEYDFDIVYVQGKKKVVIDALSMRRHICLLVGRIVFLIGGG